MKGKQATGVERIVLNATVASFPLRLLSDPKWYGLTPVAKAIYLTATMVGVWLHVKALPATFTKGKLGLLIGQNACVTSRAIRECVDEGFLAWDGPKLVVVGIEEANRKTVWIDDTWEKLGKSIGVEWLLNDKRVVRLYPKRKLTPFVKRPRWYDAGEAKTTVYKEYMELEHAKKRVRKIKTPEQIAKSLERYYARHPGAREKALARQERKAIRMAKRKARLHAKVMKAANIARSKAMVIIRRKRKEDRQRQEEIYKAIHAEVVAMRSGKGNADASLQNAN